MPLDTCTDVNINTLKVFMSVAASVLFTFFTVVKHSITYVIDIYISVKDENNKFVSAAAHMYIQPLVLITHPMSSMQSLTDSSDTRVCYRDKRLVRIEVVYLTSSRISSTNCEITTSYKLNDPFIYFQRSLLLEVNTLKVETHSGTTHPID